MRWLRPEALTKAKKSNILKDTMHAASTRTRRQWGRKQQTNLEMACQGFAFVIKVPNQEPEMMRHIAWPQLAIVPTTVFP